MDYRFESNWSGYPWRKGIIREAGAKSWHGISRGCKNGLGLRKSYPAIWCEKASAYQIT